MNVDADAVQEAIAENARVAQNQEEYSIRYEALSARFQETKDKYDAVTAEIAQRGIVALVRPQEPGRAVDDQAAEGKSAFLEGHMLSGQGGGQFPGILHIRGAKPNLSVIGIAQSLKGFGVQLFQMREIIIGLRKRIDFFPHRSKNLLGDGFPPVGNDPLVREHTLGDLPSGFAGDRAGTGLNHSVSFTLDLILRLSKADVALPGDLTLQRIAFFRRVV